MRGLGFGLPVSAADVDVVDGDGKEVGEVGEVGEVDVVGDLLGKRDGGRGKVRSVVLLDRAGFEVDVVKGRSPDVEYDTPGTGTGGLSCPPPRWMGVCGWLEL